jgi:hypothetical protein
MALGDEAAEVVRDGLGDPVKIIKGVEVEPEGDVTVLNLGNVASL